ADTATLADSLVAAPLNLTAAGSAAVIDEAAGDKGYHAAATIELCDFQEVRAYIPETKLAQPATWADKPEEQRRAAMNNRRRMARSKGKALRRRCSEVVERTFAHLCEAGGSRRSHLLGLKNVTKRYLIAVAAHNLGRILRRLTGVGKPKTWQGARRPCRACAESCRVDQDRSGEFGPRIREKHHRVSALRATRPWPDRSLSYREKLHTSTGC
ncbi:MAG: Transposase domain protein, partial [Gemmataceae bacterium]|nr:Transposase domain protein [Gemmataceae bacterium]